MLLFQDEFYYIEIGLLVSCIIASLSNKLTNLITEKLQYLTKYIDQ